MVNENLHMEVDRLRAQIAKGKEAVPLSSGEAQNLAETMRADLDNERRKNRYLESEKKSLLN